MMWPSALEGNFFFCGQRVKSVGPLKDVLEDDLIASGSDLGLWGTSRQGFPWVEVVCKPPSSCMEGQEYAERGS